jgi:hypothetical protein
MISTLYFVILSKATRGAAKTSGRAGPTPIIRATARGFFVVQRTPLNDSTSKRPLAYT